MSSNQYLVMLSIEYSESLSENIASEGHSAAGCLTADCGSKVRSLGHWAATNCAALPTANADQYATSNCKPLLFWFNCKRPDL